MALREEVVGCAEIYAARLLSEGCLLVVEYESRRACGWAQTITPGGSTNGDGTLVEVLGRRPKELAKKIGSPTRTGCTSRLNGFRDFRPTGREIFSRTQTKN